MAKQLQALQQQTAAVVAAASRSGSGTSSSSAGQFSVIQNPALSVMAAGKQQFTVRHAGMCPQWSAPITTQIKWPPLATNSLISTKTSACMNENA